MTMLSALIAVNVILLAGYLMSKRYNSSVTLFFLGLLVFLFSRLFNIGNGAVPDKGFVLFDYFNLTVNTFISRFGSNGLLIMLIGGYVSFMNRIKASDALVYVAMQPLSVLRQYPYIALIMIIPVGQLLFLAIPSAVGLGLLLVATVYPILLGLGASKLSAVSAIVLCTVFDIGPTSSNTLLASHITASDNVFYFLIQLRYVMPLILLLMAVYYFVNQYYDKIDISSNKYVQKSIDIRELRNSAPLSYAILPTLPLIFTVLFSDYFNFKGWDYGMELSSVILLSLFISAVFELVRRKSLKDLFTTITPFWIGMGRTFSSVITLLVFAEIFAQGLVGLGLVDVMTDSVHSLDLGFYIIIILLTLSSFATAIITGSGVAAFATFGRLVPEIAARFGIPLLTLMIPVQLVAGVGRAASPIAVVVIAVSEIAGVSPFNVAKRNFIPAAVITVILIILSYII